ncbi:hypothetical protein H257_13079 [Aphanomyces astaci]|uniref:RecA family profile 1 domain-containing protein n=1 Tax=Aphanomyces astaci TaxID=112090 RepID=W4FY94_APHAT|nr:hypothetical protein H257_13079 [Aphanomyces astaci]ETV71618.1 hypothetical protein H257_13079 [Aphanomyces astaci]|eukprot:XP_009838806.1 hypothetical protein H257_13079 [Aphanomyces astaci]
MLRHLLVQEGVDERRIKKLEAKGIRNLKKMFQKSEWELAHIMDLSVDDLQGLLLRIAAKDSPKPSSVMDMFIKSVSFPSSLRTTLPELDNALCGGIPTATITEIAGAAGIGKSQLCMQLAVLCALEYHDGTVLYFDSGGNFSAKRFMQLATERISPQQYSTDVLRKSKVEAIARQVQVVAVENLDRLETKVRELTESMPLIKMIIIDSLATLAKHSSTDMSVATRQMLLMRVASVLKLLASTYDAYVITTNHTTTRKDQMGLYSQPALGLAWSHCITNRVVLEKTSPSTKAMTVHKAAVAGPACIPYILTKAGVLPPEGAVGVPCVDDDEFPWDAAMMLGDFDDAQDDGFRLHPVQHASQRDSQSGGIPPDDIASQEEMVAATPSDDEQVDTKVEHLATELGQLEDSRQAARDMALSIVDDIVPASDDEEEE